MTAFYLTAFYFLVASDEGPLYNDELSLEAWDRAFKDVASRYVFLN